MGILNAHWPPAAEPFEGTNCPFQMTSGLKSEKILSLVGRVHSIIHKIISIILSHPKNPHSIHYQYH